MSASVKGDHWYHHVQDVKTLPLQVWSSCKQEALRCSWDVFTGESCSQPKLSKSLLFWRSLYSVAFCDHFALEQMGLTVYSESEFYNTQGIQGHISFTFVSVLHMKKACVILWQLFQLRPIKCEKCRSKSLAPVKSNHSNKIINLWAKSPLIHLKPPQKPRLINGLIILCLKVKNAELILAMGRRSEFHNWRTLQPPKIPPLAEDAPAPAPPPSSLG